jgi:hypothetical protein
MPKLDVPAVTSSKPEERGKRWVEVPAEDIFELPFPSIRVNLLEFGPGKHYVDADLADWIEDRVAVRQRADIAILRKNPDREMLKVMTRNGSGARQGGGYIENPDAVMRD